VASPGIDLGSHRRVLKEFFYCVECSHCCAALNFSLESISASIGLARSKSRAHCTLGPITIHPSQHLIKGFSRLFLLSAKGALNCMWISNQQPSAYNSGLPSPLHLADLPRPSMTGLSYWTARCLLCIFFFSHTV